MRFSHSAHHRHLRYAALYVLCTLMHISDAQSQTGTTGYEFLNIPVSAHSAALGGNNVSIVEDDVTLLFTNPALLANVSDKTLNFNYSNYMSSSSFLSASFAKQVGERGTAAIGARVLSYGNMKETTADFQTVGEFKATDIAVQGGYTYLFTDYWTGGVQAKVLLNNYGNFKSTALAVDLGINYFDADHGFSLSAVAQNLGGEVKTLEDTRRKLPFDLALAFSKDFANAPIRVSITLHDLTHWNKDYFSLPSGDTSMSGSKLFFNHFIIGADIFPSSQTWIAIGYNARRAYEMQVNDKSHWAGLTLGGGIAIKKMKIGLAWGKYHIASSSLTANLSYSF
ncbi:MAG: type IX secretion system protein PorQ [Bacteroidaceae bacterium]|nr:type IX secretion system protein PorQ [Bacteroidaceae bacterium]